MYFSDEDVCKIGDLLEIDVFNVDDIFERVVDKMLLDEVC